MLAQTRRDIPLKLIRLRRYNCACATKTVLLTPNSRTTISIAAILKGYKAFAQAVGQQAKEIDGKVCTSHKTGSGGPDDTKGQKGRWSCSANTQQATGPDENVKLFSKRFGKLEGHDKRVDAKGQETHTDTGWPGTEITNTKTADAVAGELSGLSVRERNTVAGLLSKTVSGAEVVEIRAVSTTSVMCNACYDL